LPGADAERAQGLFQQKIASQQQLDDASRAYEVSKNRQLLLEAIARTAAAQSTRLVPVLRLAKHPWTEPKKPLVTQPFGPHSRAWY
jgi:hypothetical protein